MTDTLPLTASDLKEILERIAIPGSLTDHPFLNSWVVAEYLEGHPGTVSSSPEFTIGQALERQLELWSQEFSLNEIHHDEWLKIFCLKWHYLQKKTRLAAYQKPPKLMKLGAVLVDP